MLQSQVQTLNEALGETPQPSPRQDPPEPSGADPKPRKPAKAHPHKAPKSKAPDGPADEGRAHASHQVRTARKVAPAPAEEGVAAVEVKAHAAQGRKPAAREAAAAAPTATAAMPEVAAEAGKQFRSPDGAPTLGRAARPERAVLTGHQRLAEAVSKYEGIKPRTLVSLGCEGVGRMVLACIAFKVRDSGVGHRALHTGESGLQGKG